MPKMTTAEFQAKHPNCSNKTLDILRDFRNYMTPDVPQKDIKEAENIISNIRNIFIEDPAGYKMSIDVIFGIKKLIVLLPGSEKVAKEFWKQIPIFSTPSHNQQLSCSENESSFTTKNDSDNRSNWGDEIYD